MSHILVAFVSGVVTEFLYAVGVVLLNRGRANLASVVSVAWGASVVIGVSQFKSTTAAVAWCMALGIGTRLGIGLTARTSGGAKP